jgi:hypothetical protein
MSSIYNTPLNTPSPIGVGGVPFEIACGGSVVPGTVVLGIGYNVDTMEEIDTLLREAVKLNDDKPLNEVVIQTFDELYIREIEDFASDLLRDKLIKEGGTLSFISNSEYSPEDFQKLADATGLTIVVQRNGFEGKGQGVDVYEKGKEPVYNEAGRVSNGGLGSRGCGSAPGYSPAPSPSEGSLRG